MTFAGIDEANFLDVTACPVPLLGEEAGTRNEMKTCYQTIQAVLRQACTGWE